MRRPASVFVFECANCGKRVVRKKREDSNDTLHRVCSRSCNAMYQNTHKTSGFRRSKLEIYLEGRIRAEYPNLELDCNNKTAIGSELDYYFPALRFAIELNGIFHYEPIYGNAKFEKIQDNDRQKVIRCYEAGIELCVINTANTRYVTASTKERYWKIVKDLLASISQRPP